MKILWMVAPQIDYGPGGAMEISGVSETWGQWVELANDYDELWLSLEMHPADHISFASVHPWRKPGQKITFQGKDLWLHITHCVDESFGAMLSVEFQKLTFAQVFHFGENKMIEPDLFFSEKDLEKIDKNEGNQIDIVGVNHSPIFRPSIAYLKSIGLNINLINNLTLSPIKKGQ